MLCGASSHRYEDNIDTHVTPNSSLVYTYNLPSNHLMGTHWYHAHHHGSTFLQVMGGMAGGLLVEPSDAYLSAMDADLRALYTSETNSHLMIMVHHFFGASDDGGGAFALENYQTISGRYTSQSIDPNVVIHDATNANFYSINGQFQPAVSVVQDDVHLLRMVHGGGARVMRMVQQVNANAACVFTLLSRDGVFQATPYPTVTDLVFVQGTRADYAVKCSLTGSSAQTVTLAAVPNTDANWPLGTGNQHTQAVMFTIEVLPTPAGGHAALTLPSAAAALPSYLNDLGSATVEATHSINLGGGQINGVSFPGYEADVASRYQTELCLNKVYQYNLNPPPARRLLRASPTTMGAGAGAADTEDDNVLHRLGRTLLQRPPPGGGGGGGAGAGSAHPYHQHINHFQITSLEGQTALSPDTLREGEWRDVAPSGNLQVRFPTDSFPGEVIMHWCVVRCVLVGWFVCFVCLFACGCACVRVVCHHFRGYHLPCC